MNCQLARSISKNTFANHYTSLYDYVKIITNHYPCVKKLSTFQSLPSPYCIIQDQTIVASLYLSILTKEHVILTHQNMPDIVCTCVYEAFIEPPMSLWTTLLDFLCSLVIGVLGVIVNVLMLNSSKSYKKRNDQSPKVGRVMSSSQ